MRGCSHKKEEEDVDRVLASFEVEWRITRVYENHFGKKVEQGEWFWNNQSIGKVHRDNHRGGCKVVCEWRYHKDGSSWWPTVQKSILRTTLSTSFLEPAQRIKEKSGWKTIPSNLVEHTLDATGLGWVDGTSYDKGPDKTYRALVSGQVPLERLRYIIGHVELFEKCACGATSPYKRRAKPPTTTKEEEEVDERKPMKPEQKKRKVEVVDLTHE